MLKKFSEFLKTKAGMTYVELLVALTLLALIIVSFTPMLLKSYETLYKAGELTENTYYGKQEIEEKLATRVVTDIKGLNVSFDKVKLDGNVSALMSNFYLGLRNVTSTTQFSLETLFYGGKGRLKVLSASVIRDDYDAKEIVVQAEGVNIDGTIEKKHGNSLNLDNKGEACVRVYLPQYDPKHTSEAQGFNEDKYVSDDNLFITSNADGMSYTLKVKGVDITTPVLKIVLWYVDENNKLQELSTVVKIEPATITIVGETKKDGTAYYTTAGVEAEQTTTGLNESFRIESRKMTGGAYPSGTTFLNVQWVSEDTHKDLDPYYVITGNNGVIQRLFISNADPETYRGISGDKAGVSGFPYVVDGFTRYTYLTKWGGDKSHQFAFSTATGDDAELHQAAYSRGSWLTKGDDYKGQEGVYAIQAKMAFYFNGFRFRTSGDERMRDGRRISYVILESGYPLRFIGARKYNNDSASWGGFITPWEGADHGGAGTEFHHGNYGDPAWGGRPKSEFSASSPKVLLWNRSDDNALNWDEALAYLNLKGFTNLSYQKATIASTSELGADTSITNYLSDTNATNIKITGSYYNPVTNQMRYLGTSTAYAYVQQADNTGIQYRHNEKYSTNTNDNARYYRYVGGPLINDNKSIHPMGSITGYLLCGSDFDGTTIYKYSGKRTDSEYQLVAPKLATAPTVEIADNLSYTGQSADFYVSRHDETYSKTTDVDLEFTLGYSSNREEVFANVTYGTDKTEYQASYERFFNHSYYTLSNPQYYIGSLGLFEAFTTGAPYRNSTAGSHYHVWFPGEFYNLTKTATKEGVTVAVGYTVSGSTYQWVDPSTNNNTSTALGSVYNDGVLAAMLDTGVETDGHFKNLLYYKDFETFANSNIISGGVVQISGYDKYKSHYTDYGTHARKSVRFQAVDIAVVENKQDTVSGDKVTASSTTRSYYAFYGDNCGRLFYSKVASMSSSVSGIGSSNQTTSTNPLSLVKGITSAIADILPAGDTFHADAGVGYSAQTEILDVNGKRISDHFSEITSITCNGNVVLICGTAKDGTGAGIVMGRIKDDGTYDRFEYFNLKDGSLYYVNDSLVLDGYIYLVGKVDNHGFVAALPYTPIENYVTMDESGSYEDENGNTVTATRSQAKTEVATAIATRLKTVDRGVDENGNKDTSTMGVMYSIAGHA